MDWDRGKSVLGLALAQRVRSTRQRYGDFIWFLNVYNTIVYLIRVCLLQFRTWKRNGQTSKTRSSRTSRGKNRESRGGRQNIGKNTICSITYNFWYRSYRTGNRRRGPQRTDRPAANRSKSAPENFNSNTAKARRRLYALKSEVAVVARTAALSKRTRHRTCRSTRTWWPTLRANRPQTRCANWTATCRLWCR